MKSFKDFRKEETVKDIIDELEKLKIHHNFDLPIRTDFLEYLANELQQVNIEPEDILASIGVPAEKQEEYLLYKSAPGCGMGKGALGDLKSILSDLKK